MIAHWLYGAAATCAAIAVAPILFLFICRRPIQARTYGTDLTEMERLAEEDQYFLARIDGIPTPDDVPVRGVLARVAYAVDGVEYRSDVRLWTIKGSRADTFPLVWYDPADPTRVTAAGLGSATALLIVAGGLAVMANYCPF